MKYYSELKKNTLLTDAITKMNTATYTLPSENSYVEILRPSVMVLGGGAL